MVGVLSFVVVAAVVNEVGASMDVFIVRFNPKLIFDSDAANRSGVIQFRDQGANVGRICEEVYQSHPLSRVKLLRHVYNSFKLIEKIIFR